MVNRVHNPEGEVRIAVVGKYMQVKDSYKSLSEALAHGGLANNVRVHMDWIDSEIFERDDAAVHLENVSGILVPGGFGERGTEGKIRAARFARERQVPFFGICYGLHMAVIEAARDLAGLEGAGSTEISAPPPSGRRPDDRVDEGQRARDAARQAAISAARCGWGAYTAGLHARLAVAEIYRRRRNFRTPSPPLRGQHRLQGRLAEHGMVFSGMSPDGLCRRSWKFRHHPWFIGVQFHPELKSRPFAPHPLFASFIAAAVSRSRLV